MFPDSAAQKPNYEPVFRVDRSKLPSILQGDKTLGKKSWVNS